ncbi:MAG: 4Fe-4S dicluster domain-containing protein [Peptococcaceae bacterium]|nr:4Fe-4S dicluster domain-containing protein [Peptococcaceae bacterium]
MSKDRLLTVDNIKVLIEDERNLLEVIRKANIELPTFCYHSEMSIYGACRLCLVEIEGRGLQPACSIKPEEGMVVNTNTKELRKIRKMILELILASHESACPTCVKGGDCQLQTLARRMGVTHIRFSQGFERVKIDESSPSLVREPNKCILCGDCVRMCNEIQGVGAIDFAFRGSHAKVTPYFGKDLAEVECVNCGQCARVCPTGALHPKPNIDEVWDAIHDPGKMVVAQLAPAVRVSLGESFHMEAGTLTTPQIVSALRTMGFDAVYDTSFAADLTVVEEAEEFLGRIEKGENIPQFTSCCPAWVSFAEQYYPEFLPHLSTCRSPQQMMGSVVKNRLAASKNLKKEDIVVVSIMPCTAKKSEALRPEFSQDSVRDVDYVLTTQELALMIKEMGLNFSQLPKDSFDLPFGFKTGGGVIFGNSGGVSEAVLRYVSEKIQGQKNNGNHNYVFECVRGKDEVREVRVELGEKTLTLAVVSGLGNAKKLIEKIKSGEVHYDLIEVMACPGGCINGGGQPVTKDLCVKAKRTASLYDSEKTLQLHKPQDNPYVTDLYNTLFKHPGSEIAHELLHTSYQARKNG